MNPQIMLFDEPTSALDPEMIKDGVHYRTVSIAYHGGLRYSHFERVGDGPAYLDEILAPK